MLDLTREERRVVLFLLAMALLGAGIKFAVKFRMPAYEYLDIGDRYTRLDLNKAELAEILRLKAAPPKLARAIIDHRTEHGPFRKLEDVQDVKGVGKYRFEKLKEYFFVD